MKNKQKELFALMSARHDGLVDEHTDDRLAQLLEGDPEAQRYYLELGALFHELEEYHQGHSAEEVFTGFPARRSKIIPVFGWAAAVAASLLAVFFLLPGRGTERSDLLVDTDSTVLMDDTSFIARVVNASDVKWGAENSVAIQGDELKHGILDLAGGSLDVVLDNGVRFGFVAPVKMELSSLNGLSLETGLIVVDVPGLSDGLTIQTPDGVLEAHTALAQVQCRPGVHTLIDVERGAVDLFTENEQGREVRKSVVGSETVQVAQGTAEPVVNTRRVIEPRIDLSQPAELNNLRYVHYSFDRVRGRTVPNTGNIPGADGWAAGIASNPEYRAPRQVPGRFGRALEFSGHGEGVLADLKEFGSDEPGSVAFWIKMDPGTIPGAYENIFTWHMFTHPEKAWHADDERELACRIRINNNSSEGVVGAVRVEFRNKWICGTTDLRDGRWHHVTAVFHRGYQGTMVRHYIDGQLARSSARGQMWLPKERYPQIGGGTITIGRVYWPERPKSLGPNDPVGLRGMIDELYVFNQAVLPSHASRLYMANSPGEVVELSYQSARKLQPLVAMIPLFSLR